MGLPFPLQPSSLTTLACASHSHRLSEAVDTPIMPAMFEVAAAGGAQGGTQSQSQHADVKQRFRECRHTLML
jgi:hypothetical protein